uniref:Putative secreted protein n=1 Tax=Amblyomma americanum TaxID=6943 RepID=A0A0C9RX17_AMBAM
MHLLHLPVVATLAATTTGDMGAGRATTAEHVQRPTASVEVVPDQTIAMPPMTAMVAERMASLGIAMEARAAIKSAASCQLLLFESRLRRAPVTHFSRLKEPPPCPPPSIFNLPSRPCSKKFRCRHCTFCFPNTTCEVRAL